MIISVLNIKYNTFCNYIDGKEPEDDFTKELDDAVNEVRDNEKWRLEYMTLQMSYQEKYELGVQDGIELGREQGIELGKISGTIDTLRQLDFNNEQIVQHIMKQFGLSEEEANKYICL